MSDSNSVLVEMDTQFAQICSSLEDAGVNDPSQLTVFDFYHRIKYYETKAKKNKKGNA